VSISYLGTEQTIVSSSSSLSIDAPADLQDRDVLLAVIARDDSEEGSWTEVPHGWREVLPELAVAGLPITVAALSIWSRYVRTVADQGATYTWTCDDSSVLGGFIVGLRGVAIRADQPVVAWLAQDEGVPSTPQLWDVPVGYWLLSAALTDGEEITGVPTGYTQRGTAISQTTQSLVTCTREVTAGNGGDQSPADYSGSSDEWCSAIMTLMPEVEEG
jgi:hypothetical protein